MWWKDYIPYLLETIIYCFKAINMVDANRVFITGYSAGGDGIYHIAGMMADMLAGAAMMAGHPNKADVYNLRNLAFSIQVGGHDKAYDRANWGKVYMSKIKELQN
jgi:poly(3-hydroxybutyrate) depolymerase